MKYTVRNECEDFKIMRHRSKKDWECLSLPNFWILHRPKAVQNKSNQTQI